MGFWIEPVLPDTTLAMFVVAYYVLCHYSRLKAEIVIGHERLLL